METVESSNLRSCLENGKWSEAVTQLQKCPALTDDQKKEIQYLISEQNFIELLTEDKIDDALNVLRASLTPNVKDHAKINRLARLIMEKQINKTLKLPDRGVIIDKVSKVAGHESFFPSYRWNVLFCQAIKWQISNCRPHFNHNADNVYSLLKDHYCIQANVISVDHFVIPPDICSEIHCMKFSLDGKVLVVGGRYGMIYFLNTMEGKGLSLSSSLKHESCDINCISFEPEKGQLAICNSKGDIIIRSNNEFESRKILISGFTCLEWLNAQNIFVGAQNHSLHLINQNGKKIYNWAEIRRTSQFVLQKDHLYCLNDHKNISIIDVISKKIIKSIMFDDKILSIAVSIHKPIMSVITNFEIKIYDKYTMSLLKVISVEDKDSLPSSVTMPIDLRKLSIIRYASFCGYQDDLIALGCTNGSVKLWHCDSGNLIQELSGYHRNIVTCIASYGVNRIASADDDGNIYSWLISN